MADLLRTLALCGIVLVWLGSAPDSSFAGLQTPAGRDEAAMAAFTKRVADYRSLQSKITGGIPRLPDKATPKQIDDYQRALAQGIIQVRKTAKRGDVFGPDLPAIVRRNLAPIFKGADGAKIRAAIVEEPHPVVPAVNVRYPDEVPLSTMPPDVLKVLPALEEGFEFRFIGRHLILLDVKSNVIVDVIDNAMPA